MFSTAVTLVSQPIGVGVAFSSLKEIASGGSSEIPSRVESHASDYMSMWKRDGVLMLMLLLLRFIHAAHA